jgi:hypothetical protein
MSAQKDDETDAKIGDASVGRDDIVPSVIPQSADGRPDPVIAHAPELIEAANDGTHLENAMEKSAGGGVALPIIGGSVSDAVQVSATEIATRRLAEITSRFDFKLPFVGFSFRQSRQFDPTSAVNRSGVGAGGEQVAAQRAQIVARREQISVLSELSKLGIDPTLFDSMLSNELDRNLKRQFGILFLSLTTLFTAVSYLVIVLAAAFRWPIPNVAITLLIAETPLQFVGLLYIIARNLFPQPKEKKAAERIRRRATSSELAAPQEPRPRSEKRGERRPRTRRSQKLEEAQ